MKRKMILQVSVMLCGIFLWWGNLFPEFIWGKETCRVYNCETEAEVEDLTGEELYRAIMHAKPEQIHVESRLVELWNALMKKWGRREI